MLSGNNATESGWAIYVNVDPSSGYSVVITNTTFLAGAGTTPTDDDLFITAGAPIDYGVCRPGYSPGEMLTDIRVNDGDFTGCPVSFPCLEGTYSPGGETRDLHNITSGCLPGCLPCPTGAVCTTEAMPAPRNCTEGKYNPDGGSQTNSSCRQCESGKFQTEEGATDCESCRAGTFSATKGRTRCDVCEAGGYCDEPEATSPSVWTPCDPGTWSDTPALDSRAGCHACPSATYQPRNGVNSSDACLACPLGTATASNGSAVCPACEAGRFMNATGEERCFECTTGSYCPTGASAALPCPSGRHQNGTLAELGLSMTSKSDCVRCPSGAFCTTGAAEPTDCSPGTVQPQPEQGECIRCEAGRFMNESGQTACRNCTLGAHCAIGSSSPLPCDAGTFGNATGLESQADCHACPSGHFCFAGAVEATVCSAGTFAENERSELCEACGEGTYQGNEGATACNDCAPGYTCPKGSVVQIPATCKEKNFLNNTLAATLDDPMDACMPCPAGSWCAGGSTQPQQCSRGTFCPANASRPIECAAGRFGSTPGLTNASCSGVCTLGHFCEAASSIPQPCPSGRYHDPALYVLVSEDDCARCPRGVWCNSGVANPCAPSTYNDREGASDLGACLPCPANSRSPLNSTSIDDCVCKRLYYDRLNATGQVECDLCPVGSGCDEDGATLTSLALSQGYYRTSTFSTEPRLCPTFSGVPGDERCAGGMSTCKGLLDGVYCTRCPSALYLSSDGECRPCTGLGGAAAGVLGGTVVLIFVLMLSLLCSTRLSRAISDSGAWRRLKALTEASGLAAKAKQLLSFYQQATSIQSAFRVTFPAEVRAVLAIFELFSLNLFELGLPLECVSLGSFLQRITFMLLAPLSLVAGTPPVAWWLLREEGGDRDRRAVLLRALPMALKLLFVVFPLVSAVAVQAFDCEHFDNGESWLRADYSLQCGSTMGNQTEFTPEYKQVRAVAALAICIYPLGVPALFLCLLLSSRHQLSRRAPATTLSTSLSFLHSEYRKRWFIWEVIESLKKLLFVSFMRLVNPGTLSQLMVAHVVALSFLILQLTAAPFKRASDNLLGLVSGAAYCLLLLGSLTLKQAALDDALPEELITPALRQVLETPGLPLLGVMIGSALASIAFAGGILIRETIRDSQQLKLRVKGSGMLVTVPLARGKTHHLFISHVWATAQDQARVLRSRLQMIVPGLRVWLDAEDLEDISALEDAVGAAQAVLVIVSAGYFQSKNCMRELVHCVKTRTPLITVAERDPLHGGLTVADARQHCLSAGASFPAWGFAADPSASVLADALLGGAGAGPSAGASAFHLASYRDDCDGADDKATAQGIDGGDPIVYQRVGIFQGAMLRLIVQRLVPAHEIFLPGEPAVRRRGSVAQPIRGHHVWCSRHNPGARELLDELERAGGQLGRLQVAQEPAQMGEADHVLLYLNKSIWSNEDAQRKAALTAEVLTALTEGRKLLLVHEEDEGRDGVAFSHFFGADATPPELLQHKIYAGIAIPMKAGAYRSISLALVERVLCLDKQAPATGRLDGLAAGVMRLQQSRDHIVHKLSRRRSSTGVGVEIGSVRNTPGMRRGQSSADSVSRSQSSSCTTSPRIPRALRLGRSQESSFGGSPVTARPPPTDYTQGPPAI